MHSDEILELSKLVCLANRLFTFTSLSTYFLVTPCTLIIRCIKGPDDLLTFDLPPTSHHWTSDQSTVP